jgi:hypothetical protein
MGRPFRAPVDRLRLKPNIPAGMDPCILLGLVPKLRKTDEDWEPIVVRLGTDGVWQIQDGRHRFFASVIAGRRDVLAVEELGCADFNAVDGEALAPLP